MSKSARVLAMIRAEPGVTAQTLAAAVRLTVQKVRFVTDKRAADGLVVRDPGRTPSRWRPIEARP